MIRSARTWCAALLTTALLGAGAAFSAPRADLGSGVPTDPSAALLAAQTGPTGTWQQWGSGELRLWGFRLYKATLWVAGSNIDRSPHALELLYRRDISRQQLVEASIEEMMRTGTPESAAVAWRGELARVFPDVKEGDRIIGLHLPGVGARFFHQGKPSGEVMDAEFARRFFAIWLDPRTRTPAVREQLLTVPRPGPEG